MTRDDFPRIILAAAGAGATVLTANKRLARHLLALYGEEELRQERSVWLTPIIVSLETWLERKLGDLGADWRQLKPVQAQRLWEEAINRDGAVGGLTLMQASSSARMAMNAHALLADYAVLVEGDLLGEDHQAFLRWRARVTERITTGRWLDPVTVADVIAEALGDGRLIPPRTLLLVGFDAPSPRLERLTAALRRTGCTVQEVPAPIEPKGEAQLIPCRDAADEVRRAAVWARRLMETGTGKIGVVVPELTAYRGLIERIFTEEIDPGALPALNDEAGRFSLSLGASLAAQGPVAAALALLGCSFEITLDEAGYLLRSPYLVGAEQESTRRARFDRYLRSLRRDTFSLHALRNLARLPAGEGRSGGIAIMERILAALLEGSREHGRKLPGSWVRDFEELLAAVGWPGERSLDSRDYQIVTAWREKLVTELAALDAVTGPMSRGEAVRLLRRLAEEREFQAETPAGNLQVCGVLEAGGLCFDHLWVLGLHEGAWPPPPHPNPFLPLHLQIDHSMPHADAAREREYARRVTERLAAAAPKVIFSYPQLDGDCSLRPSPLIAMLPLGEVQALSSHAPQQAIRTAAVLEGLEDFSGPALGAEEIARGGTAILRDQALCPFRAFAHHRLAVKALDQPQPGLDPATRGTLVHAALEDFWTRTKGQAELRALGEVGRKERIAGCVADGLEGHFVRHPPRPPEPLVDLERERLQRLLEEWLVDVEMTRPGFVVTSVEQEYQKEFGGLSIRTKIDRIDTLADGRRIIIDYKTGQVQLDDLLGERILEPQLPIYACGAGAENLAGVAIGQLRRGDCSLKGVVQDEDLLLKTAAFEGSRLAVRHGLAGWEDLLDRWRVRLEALGREFADGEASVLPISAQKACRSCDLAPLCRIDEAESAPPEGEEDGHDG